jgi:hypothetical protein
LVGAPVAACPEYRKKKERYAELIGVGLTHIEASG